MKGLINHSRFGETKSILISCQPPFLTPSVVQTCGSNYFFFHISCWVKKCQFQQKMQDKGDRNGVINHFVQFLQGHTYRGVSFLQAGSRCIGIEPLWVIASLKKFSWRFWPQNTHGKCEKTFFFSVLVTDFNRTCLLF